MLLNSPIQLWQSGTMEVNSASASTGTTCKGLRATKSGRSTPCTGRVSRWLYQRRLTEAL